MSWKDKIKSKTRVRPRPKMLGVDFINNPDVFTWLNKQAKLLDTSKSEIVREILREAMEKSK